MPVFHCWQGGLAAEGGSWKQGVYSQTQGCGVFLPFRLIKNGGSAAPPRCTRCNALSQAKKAVGELLFIIG